jgi:SAM-dependent methyltransferase
MSRIAKESRLVYAATMTEQASVPQIFDPARRAKLQARAERQSVENADFLLKWAAQDFVDRISLVSREFNKPLELFGHTGFVARELAKLPNVASIAQLKLTDVKSTALDLGPESHDLIIAPLGLHMIDDLPGTLAQIQRALMPDGLFLALLPAADTLHELRTSLLQAETDIRGGAAMRVLPFAQLQDLTGLLQRTGFTLPVGDVESLTVRYSNTLSLMRDLRAMGQGNFLHGPVPPLNREIVARTEAIYRERYADEDGRLRATFNFVSLSGWSPHSSQQKPLAPGSAQTSLTDVLKPRQS